MDQVEMCLQGLVEGSDVDLKRPKSMMTKNGERLMRLLMHVFIPVLVVRSQCDGIHESEFILYVFRCLPWQSYLHGMCCGHAFTPMIKWLHYLSNLTISGLKSLLSLLCWLYSPSFPSQLPWLCCSCTWWMKQKLSLCVVHQHPAHGSMLWVIHYLIIISLLSTLLCCNRGAV